MRRQIRIWIAGVSNACDPRFYCTGWGNQTSYFACGRVQAVTALAVALLVLGFRRAKTHRDRDLGRVFDRPTSRTIVTRVPKAISRWELRPRCRRRKIRRPPADYIFRAGRPRAAAERVVAFAFSHDGFRARP